MTSCELFFHFHSSAISPVCGFNLSQISFMACFNKRCNYTPSNTFVMFQSVLTVEETNNYFLLELQRLVKEFISRSAGNDSAAFSIMDSVIF